MALDRYIACLLSIPSAFFMDVRHYEIDVIIIVIIGAAYNLYFIYYTYSEFKSTTIILKAQTVSNYR